MQISFIFAILEGGFGIHRATNLKMDRRRFEAIFQRFNLVLELRMIG
jgi:hypothetical protein